MGLSDGLQLLQISFSDERCELYLFVNIKMVEVKDGGVNIVTTHCMSYSNINKNILCVKASHLFRNCSCKCSQTALFLYLQMFANLF